MKEVKKVKTALRAVERWEEYLFRRALGMNAIVWITLFACAGLITLKVGPIFFLWLAVAVVCLCVTGYFFGSAGLAIARKKPKAFKIPRLRRKDILIGMMAGLVVPLLTFGAAYFGGYLKYPVALPLFLGMVSVITYYTGKGYPEQLVGGTVLLVASPLIYALGTNDVTYASALALIALVGGAAGSYSLLTAPRVLKEKQPKGR